MDPLHASLQDITTLLSPSYWTRCVPWLTCSRDTDGENDHILPEIKSSSMNVSPLSIKDESLRLLRANALLTRGFLTLDVSELPNVPIGIVERQLPKSIVNPNVKSQAKRYWTLQPFLIECTQMYDFLYNQLLHHILEHERSDTDLVDLRLPSRKNQE